METKLKFSMRIELTAGILFLVGFLAKDVQPAPFPIDLLNLLKESSKISGESTSREDLWRGLSVKHEHVTHQPEPQPIIPPEPTVTFAEHRHTINVTNSRGERNDSNSTSQITTTPIPIRQDNSSDHQENNGTEANVSAKSRSQEESTEEDKTLPPEEFLMYSEMYTISPGSKDNIYARRFRVTEYSYHISGSVEVDEEE